ncbi:hypothetical protein WJX74_004168 [Apatococcus lobatus]|uniref:RING-type E3 ubiquitin transferase n=1 Tax=Apatococcus lobatus TaxID=904363 RepID=A0AAW1S9G3_9CHLO
MAAITETSTAEPIQSAFECNICYEVSRDPVVTFCGHLFCWPCLYRWLQVSSRCKSCPVCKAGVDHDKVIPIYGRGGDNQDPRKKAVKDDWNHTSETVPRRPAGRRPALIQRPSFGSPGNLYMQQGLGYLFGMQQMSGGGFTEPMTDEQQHQAVLSRLLLMLGSLVIMCLLLF